ncbi:hypothetical protein VE04_05082 [Pseudogymnoascus sp. 24MN13]|nr:hypothetical protein VE04_05082 [Pseudogymnoascus sp. 24MN13]
MKMMMTDSPVTNRACIRISTAALLLVPAISRKACQCPCPLGNSGSFVAKRCQHAVVTTGAATN